MSEDKTLGELTSHFDTIPSAQKGIAPLGWCDLVVGADKRRCGKQCEYQTIFHCEMYDVRIYLHCDELYRGITPTQMLYFPLINLS